MSGIPSNHRQAERLLALSVLQPWTWALAVGHKPLENRVWCLPARVRGQTVALHAGKSDAELRDPDVLSFFRRCGLDGWPRQAVEHRGAVIALVQFTRCLHESPSRWFVGPHAFEAANVRRLAEPVPCKGSLGFFRLPVDVEARVLAQVPAAKGTP